MTSRLLRTFAWKVSIPSIAAFAAGSAVAATPGGPGDLSPHIDIGVDADTGQLTFGYTGIDPDTPIVISTYFDALPVPGGGFTNIPFSRQQDVAFRTASDEIADDLGFSSFAQFGQSSPQIAAEAVAFDPTFLAFAFGRPVVDDPGDSFILNVPGQFLDFHPTYILAVDDPDFIGRVEGSFRFVPLTSTDAFAASDPFDLIFVVGGDYDDDSRLTFDDFDILQDAVDTGLTDVTFDLNRDEAVDDLDLAFWLEVLAETTLPVGIAGDYNDSGSVEQGDLNLVLNNWGGARGDWANADGFASTNVDQEELNRVLNNWGATATPDFAGFAVPEPAFAAVVLAFGAVSLRRRR